MPCIMNQYLNTQTFSLTPDSSPSALESTLARLLVAGNIMDSRLYAYCNRLQDRFNQFCTTCPVPQWQHGLILNPEIRRQTEVYLPLAEIQSAFRYLLLRSFHYRPFLPAIPLFSAVSWVDALEQIHSPRFSLNPAPILAEIAADQPLRAKFLASFFMPKRYGGGYDRYPLQKKFLQEWLSARSKGEISLLDAACGSGEGVYELAAMVAGAGFNPGSTIVHGCTVEPLELAAAAHGWFPQDSERELSATRMIKEVVERGGSGGIEFFRDDICCLADSPLQYDVVVCNGLLGGPLLHEHNALETAVKGLAQRVKKGGIILTADRFHAGWRRIIPLVELNLLFAKHGISLIDPPEGISGIKT